MFKVKKILSVVLVISMVLSMETLTFAADIQMSEELLLDLEEEIRDRKSVV